jgi:hypothetical protein
MAADRAKKEYFMRAPESGGYFPQFAGAERYRCSAIADGVGRPGGTSLVDRVHRPSRRVSDVQDIVSLRT